MRRQRQKNKQHAQRENIDGRVAGQNFLQRQFRPFEPHAGGKFFSGQLFHYGDRLTGADSRRGAATQLRGGIHVVADDFVRPGGLFDLNQGAQRHHFAGRIARFQFQNIPCFTPEWRIGLGRDLIGASKQIEVIDVKRSEINLQRVEKLAQRDAHRLCFGPINVHRKLRDVCAKRSEYALQRWLLIGRRH